MDSSKPEALKKSADKTKSDKPNTAPAKTPEPKVLPDFILQRNALFAELKKQNDEAKSARARQDIKAVIVLGDNDKVEVSGKAWQTTPGHLLRHVSKEVSASAIVSKVNDELWDLDRPLEGDSSVRYLSSKDPEGLSVFWHSSAHVLGEAAEHEYGCLLSHGPPTRSGFFYDMAMGKGQTVDDSSRASLESRVKKFCKEKQVFERLDVSKDDLRKIFSYSKYKMHYIEKFVPEGESSTVYRNGLLVDLCQGPHIQNTRKIETFRTVMVSQSCL